MIVVTYDVGGDKEKAARRLRHVSKRLVKVGQRVQYSVFECIVTPDEYEKLKADLLKIMDLEHDALRVYLLGKNWKRRCEVFGAKPGYDMDANIVI